MILQFLKKTPLFFCVGTILFFSSCNGEETKSIESGDTTTETESEVPRNMTDKNDSENMSIEKEPNSDVEGEVSANLNPPHGEPGHDCAIAVGASLNSIPMPNSLNMNNSNGIENVNLNPAHGEPGHDCAIAVGDPLN